MTTSPTPWTSKLRDGKTVISDASGNEIGVIYDWQNADMILEPVNSPESLSELRETIGNLKDEIEGYELESKKHSEEIERLEKEIEELKEKLAAKV